jgi:F-type H+-transporting ATPase subunit gamma
LDRYMANLKSIKAKIISYKKTGTVTHAMEAVSAVKMRKAQERAFGARAYAAAGLSILERLASSNEGKNHPLMEEQEGKLALIVVTSDKGLAGSLNSGVIKRAERALKEKGLAASQVVVFAIGRRGAEYFAARGFEVRARYENVSDSISEKDILRVAESVFSLREKGEVGSAVVVYQNFLSTFEQTPSLATLLPIRREALRELLTGITPVRGKFSGARISEARVPNYTVEPDPAVVLEALFPRLIGVMLFHAVLENKASEHSARMVAMKSATDKARDMGKTLTRTFNKVRQAAITREVSEIVGGIEAMR